MSIPSLTEGAKQKGIRLIGTGDATQPDWLSHLKKTLVVQDDILHHNDMAFVVTTEIEDKESIHHVILLPNFDAADDLRKQLRPHSSNIDHEWGGRPRVNMNGEELAGIIRDVGGMIGPAHAFTPFKAIFRENRYDSLQGCYGTESKHIHFIELGLSADSELADYIPELEHVTFITSSDAHSPGPDKIGREFVRFELEKPNFDELRLALKREKKRRAVLNVGLHPKLGKYYLSFCSSCRRTLVVKNGNESPDFDDLNIYIYCSGEAETVNLLRDVHQRKVYCPADGKKLRLGVRDRAMMLGNGKSKSPSHRPPYLHIPPLLDLITTALGVKSAKSKTARKLYDTLIGNFGVETQILTSTPAKRISDVDERLAEMIEAYRTGEVSYIAGGGGRYGKLVAPWEEST
ncbi:MAG: endonuclease Q family protein [Candidatus Thorarchaeota archaeon]